MKRVVSPLNVVESSLRSVDYAMKDVDFNIDES
jgi:hypothetical protein